MIEEKIKRIIANILEINTEDVDLNSSLESLKNFDSLAFLRIISEIEENFHISIPFDEILKINKPEDFLKYINNY